MILHTVSMGQGPALILLHGLFGTATNFGTIQRRLALGRRVIAMDLRNHGASPHDPAVTYEIMAADVLETLSAHGLETAAIVGHSMGGKVAMAAALHCPGRVARLLVADIAPVAYEPRNAPIADALLALDLAPTLTRAAADAALASAIPDPTIRRFLLANLRLGPTPAWRIGLPELAAALPMIESWPDTHAVYDGPTLVLRGDRSDYIRPEHRPAFRALFPHARFATIRGAGHWLHADAPDAFVQTVAAFIPAA